MNITRDIVIDLWPLYLSGEASAATRALVEEFLEQDPEFARLMHDTASDDLSRSAPEPLSKDHEMQTFTRTKRAILTKDWPLFFAILFSCMAFGRIVSDTSWDVSPRAFIVTASIAAVFWILFLVSFVRRMSALR